MGVVCHKEKKNTGALQSPSLRCPSQQPHDSSGELFLKSKRLLMKQLSLKEPSRRFSLELADEVEGTHSTAKECISRVYKIGQILGEGISGTVRKGHLINDSLRKVAIKTVRSKDKKAKQFFELEMETLKKLDCPYIIRFFECYSSPKETNLVMEYCSGGDLVTLIEKRKGINEQLAKKVFFQACTAVHYLHNFGIVHRDIKLDNFLLNEQVESKNFELKLIDFGFCTKYRDRKLKTVLGTPYYVAPEVLAGDYSSQCDIWSLGVVLYMMVFARPLFLGKTNEELFQQIKTKELNFYDSKYNKISPELKNLLTKILNRDPSKRPTINSILQSPWFNSTVMEYNQQWKPLLTKQILNRLRRAPEMLTFQRIITKMMVKMFYDLPKIFQARKLFSLVDYINNGVVDTEELIQSFKDFKIEITEEEATNIIDGLYLQSHGVLTCCEFVAAIIDPEFYEDDKYLKSVFDRIDIDGSNFITLDNIKDCFLRFGYQLSEETIKAFVKEFDLEKNNVISYEEFKTCMNRRQAILRRESAGSNSLVNDLAQDVIRKTSLDSPLRR